MSNGKPYTTERKEEIRVLDKGGELKVLYRIYATSKGGTFYHVDVPEDELDKADAMLSGRAQQLDAI